MVSGDEKFQVVTSLNKSKVDLNLQWSFSHHWSLISHLRSDLEEISWMPFFFYWKSWPSASCALFNKHFIICPSGLCAHNPLWFPLIQEIVEKSERSLEISSWVQFRGTRCLQGTSWNKTWIALESWSVVGKSTAEDLKSLLHSLFTPSLDRSFPFKFYKTSVMAGDWMMAINHPHTWNSCMKVAINYWQTRFLWGGLLYTSIDGRYFIKICCHVIAMW